MNYERVKAKFIESKKEIVASEENYDNSEQPVDEETAFTIRQLSSISSNIRQYYNLNGLRIKRGLDYDWQRRIYPVSCFN